MISPPLATAAYEAPTFVAEASLVQDIAVLLLAAAAAAAICRRLGMSVIVGYLLAGIVIGPNTPVPLVGDSHRIAELSELGLVFVMFSIGLRLSLSKLARMGIRPVAATALGALFILQITLMLGGALGRSTTESLFVAGMLMVSSSAVIAKMLEELRLGHERSAQTALGVTILEDLVAVVMLTVLAAQTAGGDAGERVGLAGLFTHMGAFIVLLVGAGLLLMPGLLRRFDAARDPEVRTVAVAGLLLLLAFCAQRAGYSLALGAFLCGAIVAELPAREALEKSFAPLRSVFSAVFFVSIGMLIKPDRLADSWLMTGALTLFALLARPMACGLALMLTGVAPREARRAGLLLAPLGEFTFIIAQAGIVAGALGEEFYPTAVAISVFTVLATPFINRHAEPILNFVEKLEPEWFRKALAAYHAWLAQIGGGGPTKPEWAVIRRKMFGVALEALFVTGLMVYSRRLHGAILENVRPGDPSGGDAWAHAAHFDQLFWGALIVISLVPLVAIWRTVSAVALILAQTAGARGASPKLVEQGVKTAFALIMADWLLAILPISSLSTGGRVAIGVAGVAVVAVFSRRLIYWHSMGRAHLRKVLAESAASPGATRSKAIEDLQHDLNAWNMTLDECVVPDNAAYAGSTLHEVALPSRFGCSIVEIERNGFGLLAPDSGIPLYPGDRLLLMGSKAELAAARDFLSQSSSTPLRANDFGAAVLEPFVMPECPRTGHTLAELRLSKVTGVRVVGLHRAGVRRLNPTGAEPLLAGDHLLLLGTPERLGAFREWLAGT